MLIEHQKPPPQYETPPPPAPPPTSQSDTAETDYTSSSESTGCLHVWKEKEEDMLVHLRHERQDLFLKTRNHSTLWQEISEELCRTFKTKISSTQALNKYNNLKKVERNNRCRNRDRTKGFSSQRRIWFGLWHKALCKAIADTW